MHKSKPYGIRQFSGLFIGIIVCVGILLIPTSDDFTPSVRNMGAIAAIMSIWWISEAVPIPVTALMPIFLFPLLGILPTTQTTPNYGNQLVYLFLGGFMLAAAMIKWNLHKRIALLTILIFGTRPNQIIFGFMVATAFLSMWISNTATTMMMLPIAMAVVNRLSENSSVSGFDSADDIGQLVKDNFGLALMLGIAYASSIGGIGTPIGTPPNGEFLGQLMRLYKGAAPEVAFNQWMLVGIPVVLLMLPLAWVVVTKIAPSIKLKSFTFDVSGKEVITKELKKLGPMTPGEVKVAILFGSTAALWIFRKPLDVGLFKIPGWGQLFGNAGFISDATVAMIMAVALFVIPANFKTFSLSESRKRNFLLDWRTAQENVPWGILLLFGGGFALAHGFAASGLSKFIGTRLQFLGDIHIIFVVVIVSAVMIFLTELTSNTATTTLFLPIMAVVATGMGQHPFLLMIPATLSASCAFMLPVATPPNAIVFGSGWVSVPKMSKTGLVLNLVGIVMLSAITLTLVKMVFGITIGVTPDWAIN